MRAVCVGATRGIGRALAELLAERAVALFLVGRTASDLAALAKRLEGLGAPAPVGWALLDLAQPAGFADALAAADHALGGFDTLVLSSGVLDAQSALASDPLRLERLIRINFTGAVLLCQMVAERLAARGGGTVCAFSSVTGDRARRSDYLYGATKAGLSFFLDGLGHAYAHRGVRVVCVKPGFVKTDMTAGLPVPAFAGEPRAVARAVLRGLERGRPVIYAPMPWRWIMMVMRNVPGALVRRLRY